MALGRWGWLLVTCGLAASPAQAQFSAAIDVASRARYEWRGVTRSNGWVVQPDLVGQVPVGPIEVHFGWWTSIDLSSPAPGAGAIRLPRAGLGEHDVWAEVAGEVGPLDAAAGVAVYRFSNPATSVPSANRFNTTELYARTELRLTPVVVPALVAWYDPNAVKGAYFEGSLRFRIPIWANTVLPGGSLFLSALGGYSAGQAANPARPSEGFYFANNGLTHLDFSAATTLGQIPLGPTRGALHLELHHQRNRDPLTRIADAGPGGAARSAKTWVGLTLSILVPRCRPERDLCRP